MNYTKKQVTIVIIIMLAAVAIVGAAIGTNKDTVKAATQAVTDTNGNTYTWSYTYDTGIQNAPAMDVHLSGNVEGNSPIKTDIIIPDSFTDENGVHKVQSLGDSAITGRDSFFVDCEFQRGLAPTVNALGCTELTTINKYAFNIRPNMLYQLPVTVTNIKETVFRGGGGNIVYCENPNIVFEGTDETSDDFTWVGPAKSSAKDFYGAKCTTGYNQGGLTLSYTGPSTYKLSFNKNDDTKHPASIKTGLRHDEIYVFTDYASLTDSHKEETSLLSVPTKENFIFEGFYSGETQIFDKNGNILAENINVLDSDTTLLAKWTPVKYTLSFNLNGAVDENNVFANITKDYETIITLPKMIGRTGYTFVRWDSADGKNTFADEGTYEITKNATLKAVWEEHTYKIAYDANGGINKMATTTPIAYSEKYTLDECQFVKDGYTFKEWNTKADGTGKAYKNKEIVTKLSPTHADVVTLYAIWTPNTYVISYDAGGGEGFVDAVNATYDATVTISKNSFSKKGYTFKEWNTEANGSGTSYQESEETKNLAKKGKVTLYAIWTPITYTLEYHSNGGKENALTQSYTYDIPGYIYSNNFTRIGHSFLGWSTKAIDVKEYGDKTKAEVESQSVEYYPGEEVLNLTTIKGNTIPMYAVWYKNTYHIRFDANAGSDKVTFEKTLPQTYDYGDTIVLPAAKRVGYTFLGWEDKSGNSVDKIKATDTGDISLTARWDKNKYVVKTDASNLTEAKINDKDAYAGISMNYADKITSIRLSADQGKYISEYSLVGKESKKVLYSEADLKKDSVNAQIDVTIPAEDVTLIAKTQRHTYNISYDLKDGEFVKDAKVPTAYTYGDTVELPLAEKTGCKFLGWEDKSGNSVEKIKATDIGNVSLIAKWERNEYVIKYNFDGYAQINGQKVEKSITLKYGDDISSIHLAIADGNYITECSLVGESSKAVLFSESDLDKNVIDIAPNIDMPDENVLLLIQIKGCTYNISYDLNGGEKADGAIFPETHTYGQEVFLPNGNMITKTGMEFTGWNIDNTSEVISILPATRIGHLKLIATWNLATYRLFVDPNGGDGPDEDTEADKPYEISFLYEAVDVKLPTMTKPGYTFAGWYNVTTGCFVDKIDTSLTQNQKVIAKWNDNSSTTIEYVDITGYNYKSELALSTDVLSEPNNYYYNNLSDIEKRIYTTVYKKFQFDMNTAECPMDNIKIVSDTEFTQNDVYDATLALIWEHPELFWIRAFLCSNVTKDEKSGHWGCVIEPRKAYNENSYKADALEYKANHDELINALRGKGIDSASVYDKLVMIYDEIAQRYSYCSNTKILNANTTNETRAIGYIMSHKEGCCESYAKMTKMLCNEFGIPCIVISGNEHMFNGIQIDNKWYLADITWDDEGATSGKTYFLRGTEPLISKYHVIENCLFRDKNGALIKDYAYLSTPPIERNSYVRPTVVNKNVSTQKQITKGNVLYRINGKNVMAVKATNKKIKSVTILSKVKIGKKTYKVTSIYKNAFKGCKKLKKVTIQAKSLKSIGKNAFKGIAKKAVIKVPKAKKKAYKKLLKKAKIAKTIRVK